VYLGMVRPTKGPKVCQFVAPARSSGFNMVRVTWSRLPADLAREVPRCLAVGFVFHALFAIRLGFSLRFVSRFDFVFPFDASGVNRLSTSRVDRL